MRLSFAILWGSILIIFVCIGLINLIFCYDEGDTGTTMLPGHINREGGDNTPWGGGSDETGGQTPVDQQQPAISSTPNEGTGDPVAWYNLGREYWNKGYPASVVLDAFNKAIEQDPTWEEPYLCNGLVEASEGEYVGALNWFDKAIKADPDYAEAWYSKGLACEKLGDYYYSIQAYDIATQYYNMATEAYDTSAGLTWRMGELPITMH
jgi:hypothetical protein